jgi:hypothetical protein
LSESESTAEWLCFIDESGNFNDPESAVFTSAVLIECENEPTLIARIRQAIRQIGPLAPWPMHAWLAHRPTAHALWAIARPELAARHNLGASADAARRHWEETAPEALAKALARLKEGKEPRKDHLDALTRTEDNQNCFIAFASHASRLRCRMACLGRDLSQRRILGVIAGESQPLAAVSGDRYLALLSTLLERVDELLALEGDDRPVNLIIATRRVIHPISGEEVELFELDSNACEKVFTVRPSGFDSGRTFHARAFQRYDHDVHPGLVLADFFANLTYRHARHARALIKLDRKIEINIGLSLCPGDPRRPHAAALGIAAEWLRDRRVDHSADIPGIEPVWARDQAFMLPQCWS